MNGVCLNLLPVEDDPSSNLYKAYCTEEDGSFKIDEIPPGSYFLVVNQKGKISSNEPFPTFYYPNVFEREKAAIITIAEGDFLEDLDIRAPRAEETITIEGVLLFSNGKPVADEVIEFKPTKTAPHIEGEAQAQTDANGRFTIKILKGLKGRLYGKMYTFSGEFENCPLLEMLIRKSGHSSAEVKTPMINIQADINLSDVELKFPFPSCKKAKIE